jgi:hypothetical protein
MDILWLIDELNKMYDGGCTEAIFTDKNGVEHEIGLEYKSLGRGDYKANFYLDE